MNLKIEKVTSIPTGPTYQANTLYLVAGSNSILHTLVTGDTGSVIYRSMNTTDISDLVNTIINLLKGSANGLASLDANGKIIQVPPTANKWTNPITFAITGVMYGNASIDGSSNVSLELDRSNSPTYTYLNDLMVRVGYSDGTYKTYSYTAQGILDTVLHVKPDRVYKQIMSYDSVGNIVAVPRLQFTPSSIPLVTPDVIDFMEGPLDSRITVQRTGAIKYTSSTGADAISASNTPVVDYDFDTLKRKGLLIQKPVINYALYSNDRTQTAVWTQAAVVRTDNAVLGPDDTLSMTKIVANSSSGGHSVNFWVNINKDDIIRIDIEIGYGGSPQLALQFNTYDINLTNPRIGVNCYTGDLLYSVTGIEDIRINKKKNNTFILSAKIKYTNVSGSYPIYFFVGPDLTDILGHVGDNIRGIAIGHVQITKNQEIYHTIVPTTSAPVAVDGDSCILSGSTFTQTLGSYGTIVLEAEFIGQSSDKKDTVLSIDDGTVNNRIQIRRISNTEIGLYVASASYVETYSANIPSTSVCKFMLVYNPGYVGLWCNGVYIAAVSGTVVATNRMQIGGGVGGNFISGWIRRIEVFKELGLNDALALAYYNYTQAAASTATTSLIFTTGTASNLLTYTRDQGTEYKSGNGYKAYALANTPVIEYGYPTLNCLGLLIQKPTSSLIQNSENLAISPWVLSNATATTSVVADALNETGLFKLVADTVNTSHYIRQDFSANVDDYVTLTFRIKKAENYLTKVMFSSGGFDSVIHYVVFDANTGTFTGIASGISNTKISVEANGCYVISMTAKSTASSNVNSIYVMIRDNNNTLSYAGNNIDGLYISRPLVYKNADPTENLERRLWKNTSLSTMSRSGDGVFLQNTNYQSLVSTTSAITCCFDAMGITTNGPNCVLSIDDGTIYHVLQVMRTSLTQVYVKLRADAYSKDVYTTIPSSLRSWVTVAWQPGYVSVSVNGINVGKFFGVVLKHNRVQFGGGVGALYSHGYLTKVKVFKDKVMSDSEVNYQSSWISDYIEPPAATADTTLTLTSGSMPAILTVKRPYSMEYTKSDGYIGVLPVDTGGITYSYPALTGLGVLNTKKMKSMVLAPNNFNDAKWIKNNMLSHTPNVGLGPDNTLSLTKVVPNTSNVQHYDQFYFTVNATQKVMIRFRVKANDLKIIKLEIISPGITAASVIMDLPPISYLSPFGDIYSYNIQPEANDSLIVSIIVITSASTGTNANLAITIRSNLNAFSWASNGTDSIYFGSAQVYKDTDSLYPFMPSATEDKFYDGTKLLISGSNFTNNLSKTTSAVYCLFETDTYYNEDQGILSLYSLDSAYKVIIARTSAVGLKIIIDYKGTHIEQSFTVSSSTTTKAMISYMPGYLCVAANGQILYQKSIIDMVFEEVQFGGGPGVQNTHGYLKEVKLYNNKNVTPANVLTLVT